MAKPPLLLSTDGRSGRPLIRFHSVFEEPNIAQHHINDEWVAAASGETLPVIDPFGGVKRSGHGHKKGLTALEKFGTVKTVV